MATPQSVKTPPLMCLVCGVDSGPVRTFLLLFIGALVGASLFSMAWAFFSGRLKDKPEMAASVLEAEERNHERTK